MAETNFEQSSESPDESTAAVAKELAALREILDGHTETLGALGAKLGEVADTIGRAAPLLDSKAAKVALGIERHPVLSALSGKHAERKGMRRG